MRVPVAQNVDTNDCFYISLWNPDTMSTSMFLVATSSQADWNLDSRSVRLRDISHVIIGEAVLKRLFVKLDPSCCAVHG